jgi:hypothetical protein
MIVKYLKNDVWGYIDNVRQAASKEYNADSLIKQYDDELKKTERPDIANFITEGKSISPDTYDCNKIFTLICEEFADEGINRHSENIIDETGLRECDSVTAILLYVEDCKEYDAILLVTNQPTYLMNDKGQTIERLN